MCRPTKSGEPQRVHPSTTGGWHRPQGQAPALFFRLFQTSVFPISTDFLPTSTHHQPPFELDGVDDSCRRRIKVEESHCLVPLQAPFPPSSAHGDSLLPDDDFLSSTHSPADSNPKAAPETNPRRNDNDVPFDRVFPLGRGNDTAELCPRDRLMLPARC